jgi:uncharacterized protein YodC (DUF2158 family)
MNNFIINDLVCLKTGGKTMKIINIKENGNIVCQYLDSDISEEFNSLSLTHIRLSEEQFNNLQKELLLINNT